MGGFPRVVGKEKCIKEESFRFPFGFETATRPWASFSRKGIHAYSSSPPFISLYFFLLSFSFFFFPSFSYSPIFQPQFRLTIRRRIEKRAVQTSAGFHQVLISSSFASRRGSRGCASNTTSLSLFPLVCSNTRRSNARFYSSWIVFPPRDKTRFCSVLNRYFKILFFHRRCDVSVYI